jgi:4-hydroxy-4-methyl-2-oxoglutarate aldolase
MVDKINELFSGMFSDELDKMGYRDQVITGMKLNNNSKIYGEVKTLLIETVETHDENIKTGLSFLGTLGEGDILCVQGSKDFAYFGELMTRLSTRQGIKGVVIDGLTRDSHYTKDATLPIYASGYSPKDIKGRGRVKDVNVSITIGGKIVKPGDWIFGDLDGIVIIPQHIKQELEDRINKALQNEQNIKTDIRTGKSVNYILDNYKEF